ncbi:MAG: 2-C-methyl-D-erythritol 4-phosphate cytidylyltransferase [Nitrospinae bacterium]|nr:2-C-methyl-D-erythritol 4-phosphate cytidylyltransferase [Nitrospinota bacterium]
MSVTAIIPAAGAGKRMGEPKQYMDLAGKPMLEWTLSALSASEIVNGIILVVPPNDLDDMKKKYLLPRSFKKIFSVVPGGETRGVSVYNGVKAAESDYVLIHDAARPFVSQSLIFRTVASAMRNGSATAANNVHDTVKKKNSDFLGDAVDRNEILTIQTPQVFKRETLLKAYDAVGDKRGEFTDETSLVLSAGFKVAWVEGEFTNIKITSNSDLRLATLIANSNPII